MKYQQLDNLESGWKWQYLVKKHKEGDAITHYIDRSEAKINIDALMAMEHEPVKVLEWIEHHMNPALEVKLKQAIRAKRKRHYNRAQTHTRKKSIDLDYRVWEKLSQKAKLLDATLSDTIEFLLSEAGKKEHANQKVEDIRKDLHQLLAMDEGV
ncbi:Macrodomain Ter protein [Vibrio stylophorae]|uniref:Macrodomain Ter protein n=1 Tax=Vibrio stylophorae TaxID=659351 RepID=A0ABN8DQM6_9VIBR|nr:macrodomain Ter protein MatP [Vibrio stylophorae]CAH0533481.1 Macrodomain Ter protein [Vibrio stylophorae]